MNKSHEELELHLKLRASETVSINIPTNTLESVKKIAANRDMSLEALLNRTYAKDNESSGNS